jgi:putative spermidine/putrescine transport system permease protein
MLLFLVLLPFWTSLLVRTVAWVVLLQKEGVLNSSVLSLGIVDAPLKMIFNPLRRLRRDGARAAAVHGAAALQRDAGIPSTYAAAASSLGARPFTAFRRVYLPQTLPASAPGA